MRLLFSMFLVVAGLAAWFIWPTRYQEYRSGTGPYAEQLGNRASRVDRITGDVYVLDGGGAWVRHAVQRPELLRPDVTGPQVNTRADTSPAQEQIRIQKEMQVQTKKMLDEVVEKAQAVN